MITRCSAALIWRLPPWSSRWRCVLPELAGMGAIPAARASLASVAKRSAPAISPTSLAAVSGPQPGSATSCGQLALGPQIVQAPLQRVVEPHAHADQPLAMVDQQAQV